MWIVITNSLDNTVRRLNRQTLNHCFTNTHYLAFRIPSQKHISHEIRSAPVLIEYYEKNQDPNRKLMKQDEK